MLARIYGANLEPFPNPRSSMKNSPGTRRFSTAAMSSIPRRRALACLAAVALLGAFTGCVSVQNVPISSGAAAGLSGKTAAAVSREKPSFGAMTAGKAAIGGLLGGALMIHAGNEIVRENEIEDPANYISRKLLEELAAKRGVVVREMKDVVAKGDKIPDLCKQYQNVDVLLDVQTINWSFTYFPTDWSHYRVVYSVRLRLIDVKTGQILAEGFSSRAPDKTADAPTHEELLADHAQRLKQELQTAADQSLALFRGGTLQL
jgi:hypothetical protein